MEKEPNKSVVHVEASTAGAAITTRPGAAGPSGLISQTHHDQDLEIQAEVGNPQSFEIGSMVEITSAEGNPRYGVIRWIGTLPLTRDNVIAGLELEDEQDACSDGTFGGERYFTCPDRRGFFTLLRQCRQDARFTPNSLTSDPDYQFNKDLEIQAEVDNPQSFEVGSIVEIPMAQGSPRYGVIRWIGTLPTLRDKVVAGVELEDEQDACSDGTFRGERYFTCPEGRGFFTLLTHCRQDARFTPNSLTSDPDYQFNKEIMQDSRGANAQAPLAAGQFQGKKSPKSSRKSEREFREIQQREENLQRQLREMQQREENSQRQLRAMEQREENSQRQLRAMEQREENSQRQLREMQQREENLQRQLGEMQQRENSEEQVSSLERQLREKNQEIKELELSLLSAQRRISEQRRQETCDWVISRDEIQMTENCLGRGGWGSVNEGTYCGCTVAVKQIHDLILSRHNRLLFEREMNIASACRHPCLLQFVGATNDEGSPLFVTELMEKSLRALLEQRQLSETEIAVISLDVALALNYLHQKKPNPIIHRDVSSANVLLWRQGDQWRGKVSDYGTANFMKQTMTVAPGNVIYSAPEALSSNQTPKVDVYSFGVLLCEMCIGELPDAEKREEQVLLMSNRTLRGLVRRCLQTDPEARPAMQEIIDELSRAV